MLSNERQYVHNDFPTFTGKALLQLECLMEAKQLKKKKKKQVESGIECSNDATLSNG